MFENILSLDSTTMSATSKYFVVDLQGFIEFKNLILKELCIMEYSNDSRINIVEKEFHHFIFKPPFEWKQLNQNARSRALWLKCFHHGFSWNSGEKDYSEIESVLRETLTKETNTPIVYLKGAEKVEWFNHFTKGKFECINLDRLGCALNLSNLEKKKWLTHQHYRKHDTSLHCALQNVDILHNWLYVLQTKKILQ